jgi:TonB family protein
MTESVTDIIAARSREPEGLRRMLVWSLAAHLVLVAALSLTSRFRPIEDDPPRTVMTISLGGAPGPRAGGLTTTGGRAVQAPEPEPPTRRAETPPAPVPPPMALPAPRPAPRTPPRTAPPESAARRPSTGPEPQEGSTPVETGARGQGFGLSTGGGGGTNVQVDVANFCCPEYLEQMMTFIQRNWESRHGVAGATTMQFTITRSGTIERVMVERPSGLFALDQAAQRALLLTRLPELPAQFPNPTLTVHMRFEYSR